MGGNCWLVGWVGVGWGFGAVFCGVIAVFRVF